ETAVVGRLRLDAGEDFVHAIREPGELLGEEATCRLRDRRDAGVDRLPLHGVVDAFAVALIHGEAVVAVRKMRNATELAGARRLDAVDLARRARIATRDAFGYVRDPVRRVSELSFTFRVEPEIPEPLRAAEIVRTDDSRAALRLDRRGER